MKLILCTIGLGALLTMTGCQSYEHDHWDHRGSAFDDSYYNYGSEAYPHSYNYDRDYHWQHRDWIY